MHFRFSLRTFLVVVALFGAVLLPAANFVYQVKSQANRQRAAIAKLRTDDFFVDRFDVDGAAQTSSFWVAFARKWIDQEAYGPPLKFRSARPRPDAEYQTALRLLTDVDPVCAVELSVDRLSADLLEPLRKHPQMRSLYIHCSTFDNDVATRLTELKSIESLGISAPLDDDIAICLKELPRLRELSIDVSKLSVHSDVSLEQLSALSFLTLRGVIRRPETLTTLLKNESLGELSLFDCWLFDVDIAAFEQAKNLKGLHIWSSSPAQQPKDMLLAISKAPALTKFDIQGGGDFDLSYLKDLAVRRILEHLHIGGQLLAPGELALLKPAKGLRTLDFVGDLSDEEILDLLLAAPQCKIDMRVSRNARKDYDGKRFSLLEGRLKSETYQNEIGCALEPIGP